MFNSIFFGRWRHLAEEEYAKMEVGKALGYINKAAAGFAVRLCGHIFLFLPCFMLLSTVQRAGDVSFAARGPTGFAALRAQAADIARLQKVYLDVSAHDMWRVMRCWVVTSVACLPGCEHGVLCGPIN